MFKRNLPLPPPGEDTFFLWGPRQTGKTTLLRQRYPDARRIDLLKADEFRRYMANPERLREEIEAAGTPPGGQVPGGQVVIDEIQKAPALLDEVHWLIENRGVRFALCGSSARKVRRGAANLLGGRALRFELRGLSAAEIGDGFDLTRVLNHGYLPRMAGRRAGAASRRLHCQLPQGGGRGRRAGAQPAGILRLSERRGALRRRAGQLLPRRCGLRRLQPHGAGVLRDPGGHAARPVAAGLPQRARRRVIHAPKFYFADVGIVNRLARRGVLTPGSELYGKAFENWVFHELSAFIAYREVADELSYWRLAGGTEVDFVVGDGLVAVEAKAGARIANRHLKGAAQFRAGPSRGRPSRAGVPGAAPKAHRGRHRRAADQGLHGAALAGRARLRLNPRAGLPQTHGAEVRRAGDVACGRTSMDHRQRTSTTSGFIRLSTKRSRSPLLLRHAQDQWSAGRGSWLASFRMRLHYGRAATPGAGNEMTLGRTAAPTTVDRIRR